MATNQADTKTGSRSSSAAAAGALVLAIALTLLYLYYGTLFDTYTICYNDDNYSHGLLLPLISIYMIWERKSELKSAMRENDPARISRFGLLSLLGGLFLYLLGQASGLHWINWLSLFPVTFGAIALVFGREPANILFAPIVLNFMAKPFPDSLVPKLFFPLQRLAAQVSARVLELLDVPVYLSGNIIEIPGMRLMVEEACSGMRSMMAILTVAIIVCYSIKMSTIARLLLIGASVVVAIALNIFRVAATGVMSHFYDPQAASGFFHSFSGMVTFVIALVVLYYLGLAINRLTGGKRRA